MAEGDAVAWPTWKEWLDGLGVDERQAALDLQGRLRSLLAPDPEGWARSEIAEDIAQEARLLVLQAITEVAARTTQDIERLGRVAPTAKTLVSSGAEPSLVVRLAAEVMAFALTNAAYGIDSGCQGQVPGWRLMELDGSGSLTGRGIGGLHEDIDQFLGPRS